MTATTRTQTVETHIAASDIKAGDQLPNGGTVDTARRKPGGWIEVAYALTASPTSRGRSNYRTTDRVRVRRTEHLEEAAQSSAPSLNQQLDAYFELGRTILQAFGARPLGKRPDQTFGAKPSGDADWMWLPLTDQRGMHWMLVGDDDGRAYCAFSTRPFTQRSISDGEGFCGVLCVDGNRDRCVLRTPTHVLVAVDTTSDPRAPKGTPDEPRTRSLMAFHPSMECTYNEMRDAYRQHWSEP